MGDLRGLIEGLNASLDPGIEMVMPNIAGSNNDVRWEAMPRKLAASFNEANDHRTFDQGISNYHRHWNIFATQLVPAVRFLSVLPNRSPVGHRMAIVEAAYGSSQGDNLPTFTDVVRPFFVNGQRIISPWGRQSARPITDPAYQVVRLRKFPDGELLTFAHSMPGLTVPVRPA